ncbi:MAG: leucine-rich repeat domain-containing protein, partial [Clostridiales bacterium]|nr:leucine-rich repeat domain-containing protein [Clostridiales bacterium]
SCGLYLDEDLTVPIETVYPSGVYDIPEGVNVYTKEATLDKLDFTPTGGTCSVTGSSEITGEVVIPKTYYDEESGEEIAVTKIEASAFAESYMTSLITPEGLLEIEADALKNCPEVTHVKLPDTLTTLGSGAFFGCTKLTDIDLSETQLTSIGGQAFYQCTSLESIVIPETVTTIGGSIFAKCTSLKTCVLPTGLKGMLYATFSDCTSLESITIPEGINILRYDTFKGCSSLKELVIPENVTSLEHRVIAGCTSLKKLTLPSTVTSIHNSCFQAGTSNVLEEIVVTGNGTNFQNINGFLVWKNSEVALATNSAVTVPANMTKMWPGCASLQENRTSIDFALSDATMTTLEYNVFEGCTNLKDIEIPSALTSFGVYCFYQCSSIERVEIPSGVTTIPMHCFRDCKALKEVVLNEGLRTLDLYAFCGAGSNFSLRIILPDSLERIKTQSFNGASIDTIRIPPNVTPDTTSFYQAKIKTLILDSGNALQSFYDPEENSRLNQTVVDDSVWYVLEEIDVEYSTGTIYGALTRNEGETYEWNGKVYCVYTRK